MSLRMALFRSYKSSDPEGVGQKHDFGDELQASLRPPLSCVSLGGAAPKCFCSGPDVRSSHVYCGRSVLYFGDICANRKKVGSTTQVFYHGFKHGRKRPPLFLLVSSV